MNIDWSEEKNEWLEKNRGLSFEIFAEKILRDEIIDKIEHPNKEKYSNQLIFIIEIDGYCYTIPHVKTEMGIFLKTIIPDRRMTKKYLGVKDENYR